MTIRQGKILIVDDNEDILFTLKMLLRPRVENITTCSDPKEINRLVSRNQYDVILLDMNFTTDAVSGKEGFYWLERILEIAPDTVVILITAYGHNDFLQEQRLGALHRKLPENNGHPDTSTRNYIGQLFPERHLPPVQEPGRQN